MADAIDSPTPFHGLPVLVTGGCGFIGSHLVEQLVAAGADVTVLDNMRAGAVANLDEVADRIAVVCGDVRDRDVVAAVVADAKPRLVFHLAANASVPGSVEDPAYDFTTNCGGSFVVLDVLRTAASSARVVLASSGAVYGEPVLFPMREDAALVPISPYGASKLQAEVTARMFWQVYGTPVVVARLFNTYGPRMTRFVVLDLLKKLRRDPSRLEVLGSGRQTRDFTYVSDTVRGLCVLAARGRCGESYNVSSGTSYSVASLASMVLRARGLADTAAICFTGSSWAGDAQRWEVSIDALRELGYNPRIPLSEGLLRTIEWFDRTDVRADRAPALTPGR
ncbi:NDP-sugar dehydratase or epimerase [Gemmatimonadetes bacterium T265]|nr:NDP-sugar dehydratase or epimerase [Gemmatimonadetes bacterium T265]